MPKRRDKKVAAVEAPLHGAVTAEHQAMAEVALGNSAISKEILDKWVSRMPKDDELAPPPGKPTVLYNLASEFYRRLEFETALKHNTAAIDHVADSGQIMSLVLLEQQAMTLCGCRKYEEAKTVAERCICMRPDKWVGYWCQAIALHQMARREKSNFSQAMAAYQRALQFRPNEPRVKLGLETCVKDRMNARRKERGTVAGEARVGLKLVIEAVREPSLGTNRFANKVSCWKVCCVCQVETRSTRELMTVPVE
jgi:tetratricopeptide (TPR) repeat protein